MNAENEIKIDIDTGQIGKVAWCTTRSRPLSLIEKKIKEKIDMNKRIEEIKSKIAVYRNFDPVECYWTYRLDYKDEAGLLVFSKMFKVNDNDADDFHKLWMRHQDIVEREKSELANEIYMREKLNKKREEEKMIMLNMTNKEYEKMVNNIGKIGGEMNVHYESVGPFERDSATVDISIPAEMLHLIDVKEYEPYAVKIKNHWWLDNLPGVQKVESYNNRVVKVTFTDGTFTKAVCSENDIFDLDVGITVCAMKRMFGEHGTRKYNDFIKHAHDVMDKNEQKKAEKRAEKEEKKAKQRKIELRKAAKKLKAKEEAIDIQKQAIIRAHAEIEATQKEEGLV